MQESPSAAPAPGTRQRILDVVRRIPTGRVATYGQVAELAGLPRHARLVGYTMSALPESSTVPWHRVVNAAGEVSCRREGPAAGIGQRLRLEREGVHFDARGRIDLRRFRWTPGLEPRRTPLARKEGTRDGPARRPPPRRSR